MNDFYSNEFGLKFKPSYVWPKPGDKKDCPKCGETLELVEKRDSYYGKPWWCVDCQWQYSEEDLNQVKIDSREEE